jgi:hypothetical protein
MSVDYFLVTPAGYTVRTFLERLPQDVPFFNVECERYHIHIQGRDCWIDEWDYEKNGFQDIKEAFSEAQCLQINAVANHKLFSLTAGNEQILNDLVQMIANDVNILVGEDTDALFVSGKDFITALATPK